MENLFNSEFGTFVFASTLFVVLLFIAFCFLFWLPNRDEEDLPIAEREYLDHVANVYNLGREHYGDCKEEKPSFECFWNDEAGSIMFGWNETDNHFRERIYEAVRDRGEHPPSSLRKEAGPLDEVLRELQEDLENENQDLSDGKSLR